MQLSHKCVYPMDSHEGDEIPFRTPGVRTTKISPKSRREAFSKRTVPILIFPNILHQQPMNKSIHPMGSRFRAPILAIQNIHHEQHMRMSIHPTDSHEGDEIPFRTPGVRTTKISEKSRREAFSKRTVPILALQSVHI